MDHTFAPSANVTAHMSARTRFWRSVFGFLVLGWLLWIVLETDRSALSWELLRTKDLWLFAAAWILLPVFLGLLWRHQLFLSTAVKLTFATTLRVQSLAWAGRYLPGKAGLWIAKVGFVKDARLSVRVLTTSVLLEQLLFVFMGLVIGTLFLLPNIALWRELLDKYIGITSFDGIGWMGITIGAAVSVLLLAYAVNRFRINVCAFVYRVLEMVPAISGLARLVFWHGLVHVLLGASLYPLLTILLPDTAAYLGVSGTIAALAIANIAGIVAVFAPAGLGIRDLVLAFFLLPGSNLEDALSVSALIRFISFSADVVFSFGAGALGLWLGREHKGRLRI